MSNPLLIDGNSCCPKSVYKTTLTKNTISGDMVSMLRSIRMPSVRHYLFVVTNQLGFGIMPN